MGAMEKELRIMGSVRNRDGRQRLILRYEQMRQGYNFHSLIWEVCSAGEWNAYRLITDREFVADRPCRRWISKIHGFGAEAGTAVIQVGELAKPLGGVVTYSWRLWDLERNEEKKLLHVCESPFEPWPGGSFEV